MKANIEVKFPCGYEYKLNIQSGLFDIGSVEDDMPKECPLHGKNCPPKKDGSN